MNVIFFSLFVRTCVEYNGVGVSNELGMDSKTFNYFFFFSESLHKHIECIIMWRERVNDLFIKCEIICV